MHNAYIHTNKHTYRDEHCVTLHSQRVAPLVRPAHVAVATEGLFVNGNSDGQIESFDGADSGQILQ